MRLILHFFLGDGSGGKRTEALGIRKIFEENGLHEWYGTRGWEHVQAQLKMTFQPEQIRISRDGFAP